MKKILGYIAVLVVFSWVTSANASLASIDGAAGILTISGYADSNPLTQDYTWDFTTGTVQVNEFIPAGSTQKVDVSFLIKDFLPGTDFPVSLSFNITTDRDFAVGGPLGLNDVLSMLLADPNPDEWVGAPYLGSLDLSTFSILPAPAPPLDTVLNLTKVKIDGTNPLNPLLILSTEENPGNPAGSLAANYQFLETLLPGGDPNTMSRNFTARLTVVPEPATLLLLGSGLLGLLGYSKKRA